MRAVQSAMCRCNSRRVFGDQVDCSQRTTSPDPCLGTPPPAACLALPMALTPERPWRVTRGSRCRKLATLFSTRSCAPINNATVGIASPIDIEIGPPRSASGSITRLPNSANMVRRPRVHSAVRASRLRGDAPDRRCDGSPRSADTRDLATVCASVALSASVACSIRLVAALCRDQPNCPGVARSTSTAGICLCRLRLSLAMWWNCLASGSRRSPNRAT